jgi:hypothetical protein
MAYDFIPTSTKEISKEIRDKNVSEEIQLLFVSLTTGHPHIKDPLAIDKTKPKQPKITRRLQHSVDARGLQKLFKFIKISFGDGSRGGRGTANKGNAFEGILAGDIERWKRGDKLQDETNLPIIEELEKQYRISQYKKLETQMLGEKNTKRPISYSGRIVVGKGPVDIGADVTDVDLKGDGKLIRHLSLKHGGTVTFFNAGILKTLKTSEIKEGRVKEKDGQRLLELLGVDNIRMCQIFNGDKTAAGKETVTNNINKDDLEYFIESGIGYGFQMVHKIARNKIKCFYVDEKYMRSAARVESVVVHYGGKGGNGKRIDVEITTPKYTLKMNIRDSTGNNAGYPTRIMCDYTYN